MILTALAVGALIGLVVGALGAGGGILSVPALIYLLGVAPHEATSASLVIVLFTALAALGGRIGKNTICYQIALVFAALATVGTWLGSLANQAVSADLLMYAFALLLICVGLVMLRRAYPGLFRGAARAGSSGVFSDDGAAAADDAGGTSSTPALRAVSATGAGTSLGRVALVATITGALTGFFGVGGGFAIVPALTLVLHLPIKRAASTSLLIMAITAVVALVARAQTSLNVDLGVIGAFTVASMLGAVAGAPLTRKVSSQKLTASFAALLLAVAVATLVGQG